MINYILQLSFTLFGKSISVRDILLTIIGAIAIAYLRKWFNDNCPSLKNSEIVKRYKRRWEWTVDKYHVFMCYAVAFLIMGYLLLASMKLIKLKSEEVFGLGILAGLAIFLATAKLKLAEAKVVDEE